MADRFWKSMPAALKRPTLNELYRRLRDLDYTQVDERMAVMLNAILQLEKQGECRESATEAVLMVGYTTEGISNQEQTKWLPWNVDGGVRGFDLARNPGLGNTTEYGAGEFPLPVRPSGLRKACERWVNTCLACLQVKEPRRMKFPLKSVESSEFNEVVQIGHQQICMTESGYNQILVIIDHFTKLAEAVPCQTASAEETCDHLITHWISRYGCLMTFQSDNGKAFVGDLTKELMKRSHIAQAHSTTYHPQTNMLVERQNRTLVNMLRVYCSRYMLDWDKYLPQVVGAYNITQRSTTGISPFMMLTGKERAMPLTFFYPEYERKGTSPQAYVEEAIRRQQELSELCRRKTAQAQMRQRKKYDEKILQAKPVRVGLPECHTSQRYKKTT